VTAPSLLSRTGGGHACGPRAPRGCRRGPCRAPARHQNGDWGVVPPADAKENDLSVTHGFRIISSYAVGRAGERVWIITEADRSSTCILFPKSTKRGVKAPRCRFLYDYGPEQSLMDSVSGLHGEALEAESADHRRSREAESGASTGTKSYRNRIATRLERASTWRTNCCRRSWKRAAKQPNLRMYKYRLERAQAYS